MLDLFGEGVTEDDRRKDQRSLQVFRCPAFAECAGHGETERNAEQGADPRSDQDPDAGAERRFTLGSHADDFIGRNRKQGTDRIVDDAFPF